mmetsp:Transcript_13750/g.26382  ORF Transcript_13750/g.26382 Transcript_13750/m.26382 type:complete len:409 (-) Transcript_13750:139-1365(-)
MTKMKTRQSPNLHARRFWSSFLALALFGLVVACCFSTASANDRLRTFARASSSSSSSSSCSGGKCTTWTSNWSSDDDKKDKKDKDTPVKVTEASDSMEEAAESADDDDEKEKELSWRERLEQRREKMRADLKKRREARKQREEAKAKAAAVDEKPEETPVVEEVVADETPAEVVEEATEDEVVVEDEPSLVEDIVEEAVNCPENAVFNEQSQECECEQGYTGDATQGCARACPLNSQFNERRDVCECLDGYEGDATDPEVGCTVPEQDNSGARSALSLHNQYRRRHGASALSWSTELEKVAQDWANKLARENCAMYHSNHPSGENLGRGYRSINDAVTAWYEEEELYNYNNPGFSSATGHFTQVVWKGTENLGCAIATCSNGRKIYSCNYDPPGNYRGRYEENVLPPQ